VNSTSHWLSTVIIEYKKGSVWQVGRKKELWLWRISSAGGQDLRVISFVGVCESVMLNETFKGEDWIMGPVSWRNLEALWSNLLMWESCNRSYQKVNWLWLEYFYQNSVHLIVLLDHSNMNWTLTVSYNLLKALWQAITWYKGCWLKEDFAHSRPERKRSDGCNTSREVSDTVKYFPNSIDLKSFSLLLSCVGLV
jgi:hypothetical protein